MRIQKTGKLKGTFKLYLVGALALLGIKYYYSQADCDSLLWILKPTTRLVEFLSGIPFTYISGTGYVNHSLRLLIAPSCSGVRFMVITAAMLIFSFVHIAALPADPHASRNIPRDVKGLGFIAASIVFSWLFTIFVNGLRIITAIYLPLYLDRAGLMGGLLTPDRLHTVIGVIVYFSALLTLYRLISCLLPKAGQPETGAEVRHTDNGKAYQGQFPAVLVRKCLPPLFWYLFMTLGIPLLGRTYLKEGAEFREFAILIICCIALILIPYGMLSLLRRRRG